MGYVAGEDAVAGRCKEHDGRVYWIGGARRGLEFTCLAAVPLADQAHVNSLQQPC